MIPNLLCNTPLNSKTKKSKSLQIMNAFLEHLAPNLTKDSEDKLIKETNRNVFSIYILAEKEEKTNAS